MPDRMADRSVGTPTERVEHVQAVIAESIGDRRFRPNLILHETEAWVFAAADELGELRAKPDLAARLHEDCAEAGGPELVNSTRERAPSKRLLTYLPDYGKLIDGPLVICERGLSKLRADCPHLDAWLRGLERRLFAQLAFGAGFRYREAGWVTQFWAGVDVFDTAGNVLPFVSRIKDQTTEIVVFGHLACLITVT
jgi:hypothetical protein